MDIRISINPSDHSGQKIMDQYAGDDKADLVVYCSGVQGYRYLQQTTAGSMIRQFGAAGDMPVPNAFVRQEITTKTHE
jgi:hypothetical protein